MPFNYIRWLLFLLCLSGWCSAQNLLYRQYTVEDGLPSNTVYTISQDKSGFIWLATDNGVARFDGYKFEVFNVRNAGLPTNSVYAALPDSFDNIWINTFGHFGYLNAEEKRYHQIIQKAEKDKNYSSMIRPLSDQFGQVSCFYPGQGAEFIKYDENGDTALRNFVEFEATIDPLRVLNYDDYVMLFQTDNWWTLKKENGKLEVLGAPVDLDQELLKYVSVIDPTHLVFADRHEIFRYQNGQKTKILSWFDNKTNRVNYGLQRFNEQNLILSTNSGLFLLNHETESLNPLIEQTTANYSFSDQAGNIWVSSFGQGLFFISAAQVEAYVAKTQQRITSGEISAVNSEKPGSVWYIGKNDSLYLLENGITQSFYLENFLNKKEDAPTIGFFDDLLVLTSKEMVRLLPKDPDEINQILRADECINYAFEFYAAIPAQELDLSFPFITDIYPSTGAYNVFIKDDTIFFQRFQNMLRKVWNDGDRWYYGATRFNKSIGIDRIILQNSRIIIDRYDQKWLSSSTGLFGLDYDTLFKIETHAELATRITDIKIDKNGRIWVASELDGLVSFRTAPGWKITEKRKHELNKDFTPERIFIDKQNRVWLSSSNGLFKLNTNDNDTAGDQFEQYSTRHGFPSNDIKGVYVSGDTIWAATVKGMYRFIDNRYEPKTTAFPLQVLSFSANDRELDISTHPKLRFTTEQILVKYAGLSYQANQNITYYYMLMHKGIPGNWQETRLNELNFSNLGAGEYALHIRAEDMFGRTSDETKVLKFSIGQPFYNAWWFWTLVVVAALGLIFLYFNLRLKRLEKVQREKTRINRELARLELKAVQAQMNPHFISNVTMAINNLVLEKQEEKAAASLSAFSRLMRLVLESSMRDFILLEEEIELLENYIKLEILRFPNEIRYEIEIDEEVEIEDVYVPSMVLQPLVENSFKHAYNNINYTGLLKIKLQIENNKLEIFVIDNGVGMEKMNSSPNGGGTVSRGTQLIFNKFNLIKQKYGVEINLKYLSLAKGQNTNSGTEVMLELPLLYQNLSDESSNY